MSLPDFVIVGTMKSGTSTLSHYISQHPDVYMPDDEVHFFDARGGYKENWGKGVEWYRRQFEQAPPGSVCGEKTPTYSYLPGVPKRMHNVIPGARLVWIFRDPVRRTYSNYWHAVRSGIEYRSFEDAVRQELKGNVSLWRRYLQRSDYVSQVRRFLDLYDIEDMFFTTLNKLYEEKRETLRGVFDFVGVRVEDEVLKEIKSDRKNVSHLPLSYGLRYAVTNMFGKKSFFSKVERKVNRRITPGYPDMSGEIKEILYSYFEDKNEELQDLIGLNVKIGKNNVFI